MPLPNTLLIPALLEGYRAGRFSPVDVVEHFLGRIEELDPKVKAFAHIDVIGARTFSGLN